MVEQIYDSISRMDGSIADLGRLSSLINNTQARRTAPSHTHAHTHQTVCAQTHTQTPSHVRRLAHAQCYCWHAHMPGYY